METTDKPFVSVIMTAYNESPDHITDAINSILCQTYTDLELIILDDSTNEDTIRAIDAFNNDHRVSILRSNERLGLTRSLNRGLESSQGKYIAKMDGDDISLPERLEKEVEHLESHPDTAIVGGQINIIDEYGNITSSRKYPSGGLTLYLYSCFRNPLAHPTVLMRRDIVDNGYRYDSSLKMSEDLDLWLRLINNGYKIRNLPDTLVNYRVSDDFLDKRCSDTQRRVMAQVRYKNFYKRRPVHSVLSAFSGWLFIHVPRRSIANVYKRENRM